MCLAADLVGPPGNRAIAGMSEMYPMIVEQGTRRPVPMGNGGGRNNHRPRDAQPDHGGTTMAPPALKASIEKANEKNNELQSST